MWTWFVGCWCVSRLQRYLSEMLSLPIERMENEIQEVINWTYSLISIYHKLWSLSSSRWCAAAVLCVSHKEEMRDHEIVKDKIAEDAEGLRWNKNMLLCLTCWFLSWLWHQKKKVRAEGSLEINSSRPLGIMNLWIYINFMLQWAAAVKTDTVSSAEQSVWRMDGQTSIYVLKCRRRADRYKQDCRASGWQWLPQRLIGSSASLIWISPVQSVCVINVFTHSNLN